MGLSRLKRHFAWLLHAGDTVDSLPRDSMTMIFVNAGAVRLLSSLH